MAGIDSARDTPDEQNAVPAAKRVRKPAVKKPAVAAEPAVEPEPPVFEEPIAYSPPTPTHTPPTAGTTEPPAAPVAPEAPLSGFAVTGLVFAILFPPLGILFSFLALGQIRRGERSGRAAALFGAILSIALTVTLAFIFWATAALFVGIVKALAVLLGAAVASVSAA